MMNILKIWAGCWQSLLSWKETKGFDKFIMLIGVRLLFHMAVGSHPVQEAWDQKIVCTGVKFKNCFNVVKKPYQQIPLIITIQKKYSLTYHFVVIEEKVRGQNFGSTGVKFCWQWSQNDRLVNTIQIQTSLLCVACFGNMVMKWES